MFARISTLSKKYIHYWEQIIKRKNIDKILDQILIISLVFSIFFVVVYKIVINIEKIVFHTNFFVLPEEIKVNLPFAYFVFLCSWIVIKFILNSQESILTRIESKELTFKTKHLHIKVQKDNLYKIFLIVILALSVIIKIPYFNYPFVGSHPMKYSTYAEPAYHMYEKHDPFFFKRNYMYNPLNPSEDSAKLFGNLPLMEWSLYTGYESLGNILPIETITRLVTSLWGALALYSLYFFVQKFTSKKIALATIALFSFNPIFNLASYVTVYDIITFPLTFFSLAKLLDLKEEKKIPMISIAIAGLLIGIGASIKTNILIWSIPITTLIFFFQYKYDYKTIIKILGYYLLWIIIPMIFVRSSLSHLPSKELSFIILTFLEFLIIVLLLIKQSIFYKFYVYLIEKFLEFATKRKIVYFGIFLILITSIAFVYQTNIAQDYLTDSKLILNSAMYKRMLYEQIVPYTNVYLFTIFLYTLPFLAKNFKKRTLFPVIALLLGLLFYVVIASKPLFFHNYYWIIILAPLYITISLGIFRIAQYIRNDYIRVFFTILFFSTILLLLRSDSVGKINRNDKDIYSLSNYFNSQNLEKGISYIDQANTNYILFKTDLRIIYSTDIFDKEEFKIKVREIGLIETLKYYKILYIIVPTGTEPNYLPIANAFDTHNQLIKNSIRRSDQINEILTNNETYYPDLKLRNEIITRNRVKESFNIEAKFGVYTIYKVQDICLDLYSVEKF